MPAFPHSRWLESRGTVKVHSQTRRAQHPIDSPAKLPRFDACKKPWPPFGRPWLGLNLFDLLVRANSARTGKLLIPATSACHDTQPEQPQPDETNHARCGDGLNEVNPKIQIKGIIRFDEEAS